MRIKNNCVELRNAVDKRLNREEESALILRFQSGDKKAGDTLIKNHVSLILHMASRYSGLGEHDEILQQAMFGMLVALQRFNVNGSARFSSFAVWGMKQHILKYCGRKRHMLIYINTQNVQRASDALNRAYAHMRNKYGSQPTESEIDEKICEFLSITDTELQRAKLHHRGEFYLDDHVRYDNEHSDGTYIDGLVGYERSYEELMIEAQTEQIKREAVAQVLAEQDQRTKDIMTRRYMGEVEETWTSIAKDYNITQQGICSSMAYKLRKIKRTVKSRLLFAGHEV